MKLLRLKITDPDGFRSLHCGFEHYFRTERSLKDELESKESFAPFICAGPNGSGKSNLLEVLAAIFFQLEVLRIRRSFLPEALQDETLNFSPKAFELEYLISVPQEYHRHDSPPWARVSVWKAMDESVRFQWDNQSEFETDVYEVFNGGYADILLPQYVLAYSSGENEILSLPFFKMRFIQFDEYLNALSKQLSYAGRADARLAYIDSAFSQAVLLCNLLFQSEETLKPFREDVGIEALKAFRIVIRRSIPVNATQLLAFASDQQQSYDEIVASHSALSSTSDDEGNISYRLDPLTLLEGDEQSSMALSALKRCATSYFEDEETDSLILDYWVNDATKRAFQQNFDDSALTLFQSLQVLLTLNLYSVSSAIKQDLYQSTSNYVNETIPVLASDQRIMRFKFLKFSKNGVSNPVMLKDLSDGEHQLLHSLGLCMLFRETNSLFLLDEPETHFNPDWRANFITRLSECFPDNESTSRDMLITTHSPFLISDSTPDKVLVFDRNDVTREISISNPQYNTLGASINKITMSTFVKRETIGGRAQKLLEDFRRRFEQGGEDKEGLIDEIHSTLGDSVEKILLINAILDGKGEMEVQR